MRIIKNFESFAPTWTSTTTDNSIKFRSTTTASILNKYAGNTTRMPKWAGQAFTAKPNELHKKTEPRSEIKSGVNLGALLVFRRLLDMAEELGYYVTPNDTRSFGKISSHVDGTHQDLILAYLISDGVITIECEDEDGETVMSELDVEDVSQGIVNAPMDCVMRLVSGDNDELDVDTALRAVVNAGKKI